MDESFVRQNLEQVRKRIAAACERCGRSPEEVTLIAVSKTKPVSMVREAMEAGAVDFGENKVQELCDKYGEIAGALRWHLIGHLQRNKVKYVVDKAFMIHSVDSLRLAEEIQKEAEKKGCQVDVLIEVNIGGEETKSGVEPEEAAALVREVSALSRVHIKGLMAIAPIAAEPEEARPYFARLRELRDEIGRLSLPGVEMKELSMGMTGDFEVAIEEGATMVRVGTAIFGGRTYH